VNEKVGLKIVELLHDITQLDYYVQFCDDFEGMIRAEFREAWNDKFYEHAHLGFPGCERIRLEKDIIECLSNFLERIKKEQKV
jgi:hypothetical protein